jgi:hypothetical protein
MRLRLLVVISLATACSSGPSGSKLTVTESGDHVTVTPSGSLQVDPNATATFDVAADSGYTLSATVGGDCPAGTWTGISYTTGAITADCSVSFSATINGSTFTASASGDGHETITPALMTVAAGATASFTVAPSQGYTVATTAGGDCPAGSWSGTTYTTGALTADCTVTFTATQNTAQVTSSGDGNETISPSGAQTVNSGDTQAFTVTPNTGYTVDTTTFGDCPAGTWSGATYTTGAITADCSVSFTATLNTYQVTSSGDGNETISPSGAQTVSHGSTISFTVDPAVGHTVAAAVGGDCPAGTWASDVYTTGAITAPCSVSFSATLDDYQVGATGDGNETIDPPDPQAVFYGETLSFTVDPAPGYTVDATVGGDCPTAGAAWAGDVYTTGVIGADCSVSFTATLDTFQVAATNDTHTRIQAPTTATVSYGGTASFIVTFDPGYELATVTGDCPAGSWSGATYTTGTINGACDLAFSSQLQTFVVYGDSDGNETLSADPTVTYGGTATFTVTALTGYTVSATVGGGCASGSWSGSDYTTGVITYSCHVAFSATANTSLVNAVSSDGFETITPSGAQSVTYPGTQTFTVTADPHHTTSLTVGGDCPGGGWSGSDYTTGSIATACTVSFSAPLDTYLVQGIDDGHESVTPGSAQTGWGTTQTFTVTANGGYEVSTTISGDCPAGTWSGNDYTTGAITAACQVKFSATRVRQATAVGDGHETIAPTTTQTVPWGDTVSFTVDPQANYLLGPVGGDCPPGTWSGDVYTTGTLADTWDIGTNLVCDPYPDIGSGSATSFAQCESRCVGNSSCHYFAYFGAGVNYCNLYQYCGPTYGTSGSNDELYGLTPLSCTVTFSAAPEFHVTPVASDGNETISPSGTQIAAQNTQVSFTVDGIGGHTVSTTVGGSCPQVGSWNGDVYTIDMTTYYQLGTWEDCDNTQAPITTTEVSAQACDDFCVATPGCTYFAYYPEDDLCSVYSACTDMSDVPFIYDELYTLSPLTCTVSFTAP